VDVTVIAATNRDLRAEVAAGRFRGDLFYRLNVVEVELPPLREHREDIPYFTAAFIGECAQRMQKPLTGLTPGAERLLFNAAWDGNVRELKNVVERACMLAESSLITERDIEGHLGPARKTSQTGQGRASSALHTVERGHIVDILRQVNGNRMAAAKMLGISRRALYRRLERHQIVDIS
jgi:two-component system response regulator AtoC